MLKVRVITPGKDKESWITDGCRHYRTLLSRYANIEMIYLPTSKSPGALTPDEIKLKEALQFAKHLGSGPVVALDAHGKAMDSRGFARFLDRYQTSSKGKVAFLIGGAFGLDAQLLRKADASISLSPLTFPHQLVRLIFLEQLYRAFSILHGTSYHK